MRFSLAALAFGALSLSACDSVSGPDSSTPQAVTAAASVDAPTLEGRTDTPVARHMVSAQRLPADFEATVASLGGTVAFTHSTGFAIVDGLSDADAATLLGTRGIDEVVADVVIERSPIDTQVEAVEAIPNAPSDAFFYGLGYQWHMDAISAPTAWAAGRTGSSDVTVAVIDSGLDETHADLAGLVDASRSVSFLAGDEFDYVIRDVLYPGAPDYTDLNGHGTHVGATISSNGIVGAGVTENVTLMAVKACRYSNSCSGAAIIAGLLYAADNGADVANMSLGGSFNKSDFPGYVGFLNQTFNYARRQGLTIVVSAGNSALDLDHDGDGYKTYCTTPATICVSATGPTATDDIRVGPFYNVDALASYSNYGRSAINVAAPGGSGSGFVWAACSSTGVVVQNGSIFRSGCSRSKTFITAKAGTSMAAPHVSGLAALLVEDYGRNPARIETRMQQTADDLGQPGTDPAYGKGRINVARALGLDVNV